MAVWANRVLLGVVVAVLAILAAGAAYHFAAPRAAAELWVQAGGSGSSCSKTSPCGTILAASNAAQPGDAVNIVGNLALSPFTTVKAGIEYRCVDSNGAYRRHGCKLQPANGTSNEATLWTNMGEGVTIRGLEVDGRTPDGKSSARVLVYATPTGRSPVNFVENHVHHGYWRACSSGGAGLLSDAYSVADAVVNFDSNFVHNIGSQHCNQVHGIYMSTNGYVRNNVSNDNAGWGIQSWHDAKQNDIDNNTACGNMSGNISVGSGDYYHPAQPWTGRVQNNIACNAPYGINVYGDIAAGQAFTNNLTHNNTTNLNLKNQSCGSCITGDPKFVGGGDYHLQPSSPAIDHGVAVAAIEVDMDGNSRPQGAAYDIGAYEYGSAPPPNPTPSSRGNALLIYVPPGSCGGLPSGAIWADAGAVKVCP